MNAYVRVACLLSGILLMSGCEERQVPAPVEELTWRPFNRQATYHTVRRGDTLYSIAFRYEKDYPDLAAINQLKPPFDIQPGQRIRLKPSNHVNKRATRQIPVRHAKAKTKTLSSIQWQWPLQGRINRYFSPDKGQKGIDIGVANKQVVHAAANGLVAYSGDGIPGYGHLIIIKHNQAYLTAYAHNDKNLVNEGDRVCKGQKIAYTGHLNAKKYGVHFELRKQGKPVNPLNYLLKG